MRNLPPPPLVPKKVNERERDLPLETRAAPITAIDAEARTVDVTWTAGARVDRFDWMSGQRYAELQATSHFSFLRGARSCEELFATASLMGIDAVGIVDRNSLAGVVRAHVAARTTGIRLIVGCRLDLADGMSVLHETVYEDRLVYVPALKQMGAEIELFSTCLGGPACRFHDTNAVHSAVVKGVSRLRGAKVEVPDVRAGFSSVIAAAIADGPSEISGIHHLVRGYHRPLQQFAELGLPIEPIDA